MNHDSIRNGILLHEISSKRAQYWFADTTHSLRVDCSKYTDISLIRKRKCEKKREKSYVEDRTTSFNNHNLHDISCDLCIKIILLELKDLYDVYCTHQSWKDQFKSLCYAMRLKRFLRPTSIISWWCCDCITFSFAASYRPFLYIVSTAHCCCHRKHRVKVNVVRRKCVYAYICLWIFVSYRSKSPIHSEFIALSVFCVCTHIHTYRNPACFAFLCKCFSIYVFYLFFVLFCLFHLWRYYSRLVLTTKFAFNLNVSFGFIC